MSQETSRHRNLSSITEPKLWRNTGEYESGAANWREIRETVLKRNNYTCQECGFVCTSHQEVHHINGDHTDNRLENLETLCTYCHGTQHIGFTGQMKRGVLIWLPELSRSELINICRWMMCSPYFKESYMSVNVPNPDMQFNQAAIAGRMEGRKNPLVSFFEQRIRKAASIFQTTELVDIATAMRVLEGEAAQKMYDELSQCHIYPLLENYPDAVLKAWSQTLNQAVVNRQMEEKYLGFLTKDSKVMSAIGFSQGYR